MPRYNFDQESNILFCSQCGSFTHKLSECPKVNKINEIHYKPVKKENQIHAERQKCLICQGDHLTLECSTKYNQPKYETNFLICSNCNKSGHTAELCLAKVFENLITPTEIQTIKDLISPCKYRTVDGLCQAGTPGDGDRPTYARENGIVNIYLPSLAPTKRICTAISPAVQTKCSKYEKKG